MAEQARVTSLDTLESFRTGLIIFVTKARNQIDLVSNEIHRTRIWLQTEQKLFWETEIRRRKRALDQAQSELMTAKLSSLRDDVSAQMNAVRKAKAALEEAELKLRNVRKWAANFDSVIDPLAKKMESLREVADYRLPKGIARLSQIQRTLEDYAGTTLRSGGSSDSRPEETGAAGDEPAAQPAEGSQS